MRIRTLTIWASAIAITFLAAPAHALSLTSAGVVGAASGETKGDFTGLGDEGIGEEIANHLLAMGANESDPDVPSPCSVSGTVTCYQTSAVNYDGVLDNGESESGVDPSGYEYVLAKYNGNNAGYVLFHVPTWQAAFGTNIPEYPQTLWGTSGQYRISHFIGFGSTSVPDGGATLSLLGLALAGVGVVRRYINA